jgi:hypothetical protein
VKTDKIQKQIFNAMLDNERRLNKAEISETETAFTYDGYCGFVLQNNEIRFDVSKIPTRPEFAELFKKRDDDCLVEETADLKMLGDKRLARKLSCRNPEDKFKNQYGELITDTWVNMEYLKPFDNITQMYTYGNVQRILVFEARKPESPVAVLLPIRVAK